jgi:hypothetical protein
MTGPAHFEQSHTATKHASECTQASQATIRNPCDLPCLCLCVCVCVCVFACVRLCVGG